jgi:hypothetical protein
MKPRIGEFDYLGYALRLAGRMSRVVVKVADGADHSFANRLGRDAVRVHAEQWLGEYFPIGSWKEEGAIALYPERPNKIGMKIASCV